jgi:hypothetical protein
MNADKTPPAKSLTSADLAFIDAAIAMQKATQMTKKLPHGALSVSVQPDSFTDIIQVVVAVVQVATFVYHAVKGSITLAAPLVGAHSDVSSTASLQQLIAQRNELAKALGDPSVLS